ncbi:MAG: nucleotidyltransferase domain-containing protein [Gaiellales bacterium]
MSAIISKLDGRIFQVLARTTAPLTGARVAALAGNASYPGILTALSRLVQQGTVLVEAAGSAYLYRANREHILWPAIEQAVSAADAALATLKTRMSGLVDEELGTKASREVSLAIFGSVARETSTVESDLDVVVVFPDALDNERASRLVDVLSESVRRWTGNQCNVYSVTTSRLRELVAAKDPIVGSWRSDAATFHGADLRDRL